MVSLPLGGSHQIYLSSCILLDELFVGIIFLLSVHGSTCLNYPSLSSRCYDVLFADADLNVDEASATNLANRRIDALESVLTYMRTGEPPSTRLMAPPVSWHLRA